MFFPGVAISIKIYQVCKGHMFTCLNYLFYESFIYEKQILFQNASFIYKKQILFQDPSEAVVWKGELIDKLKLKAY